MKKVISTCIYCGCGCKLTYHIENNKIIKISGFKEDYMSEGKPCIKGLTINEVWNKNRIKTPHIRKNGKLVKCSWEEAIERIYQETKSLKPEEIFFNGSGKITNEDNLLIYKLGTCLYNTKNIDSCCGRLCHISTVKGVVDCFGAPNLTDIKNLNKTDCLFIIGSNPAVNYPVFWNKVLKRKKQIKIISVQPLQNLTSKFGNIFLEIEPGAETALLNGIINYLIQNKKFNKTAVNFPQFQKLKTLVSTYTPEYVLKHTGIKEKDFLNACRQIADCKQLSIFHGMGFTQHINSLENIYSLLNLVLLKDAHILTLRGEINVQGVGDVFSSDPKILSKLWGKQIKKPQGNLINSLFLKPVKAAFITEFNPAQSLPNLEAVYKKLQKMFIVYIGSYFNITCHYADVILPIPALFECLGTITNGEQTVRLSNSPLTNQNPGLLQICKLLSKKFKKESLFNYNSPKEIFSELTKSVPWYQNINTNSAYSGKDSLPTRSIKHRKFFPEPYKGKDESRSKQFPFLLTTFREQHHFLTAEITGQSPTLRKLDKDRLHVFINPKDAKTLGIKNGNKVKLTSKTGTIQSRARVSDKVPEKLLATRYHYKEMLINKLFPPTFDDITFTPNYKCCAVRIEKV